MTTYDISMANFATRLATYFIQYPDPHAVTVTVHPASVLYTQQALKRLNPQHTVTVQADWYSRTPGSLSIVPDDQQPQQYRSTTVHTYDPTQPSPPVVMPKSTDEMVAGIQRLMQHAVPNDDPDVLPLTHLMIGTLSWAAGEQPTSTTPAHAALLDALQGPSTTT